VKIELSEMRELQTLLISCLTQERISGSMFRVLGKVVNHVVCEMFKHQDIAWDGLRDYIVSQSKTKFHRAVYIFQCLTTPLEDDEFVIHVMENLLPEIRIRLNPPRDLLVDNSCWVLAFTGAFCAIKGMKWESKIVLWRINVIVERGVNEKVKELPKDKFDWLNLPEADGFEQSEILLADYGF